MEKEIKEYNKKLEEFFESPSIENMKEVFRFLINHEVHVTVVGDYPEEDLESVSTGMKGKRHIILKNLNINLEFLRDVDTYERFIPLYIDKAEALPLYEEQVKFVTFDFSSVYELFKNEDDCAGFVLNPYSNYFKIRNEYLDYLKEVIEEEKNKKENH